VARERPAADDDLGRAQEAVALVPGPLSRRAGSEVALRGIVGPGVADFAVEPAAGIDEPHPRVHRFDPRPFRRGRTLDAQYVDVPHPGPPPPRRRLAELRRPGCGATTPPGSPGSGTARPRCRTPAG